MHREKEAEIVKKYDTKSIRHYIGAAKKLKPMLTNEAALKLRAAYTSIRKSSKESGTANVATVRQL